MKIALCVVLLALSFAPPALAGQVYGSIFQNGRPPDGAPVLLRCGGETASNVTDVDGVYRLFARATGAAKSSSNQMGGMRPQRFIARPAHWLQLRPCRSKRPLGTCSEIAVSASAQRDRWESFRSCWIRSVRF